MKFQKLILLLLCAWLITPKNGYAIEFTNASSKSAIKEISHQNNTPLVSDFSAVDVEDDNDNGSTLKKNFLKNVYEVYNCISIVKHNSAQSFITFNYHTKLIAKPIATYIITCNFRI